MAKEQRKYDMEYKIQAVKLAKEIGGAKAAAELGIPENTLYAWIVVIRSKCLAVFVCHIFHCITHLMDNAALIFRLRKGRVDCLFYSGQAIGTDDKDIFHAAVFQAVQYGQPACGLLHYPGLSNESRQ